MSISINSLQSVKSIPEVTLQHLPCKVEADDAASISSFFCPKTVKGENKIETLSATFRGRPLDGKNINLPEGYVGVMMAEKQEPYSEDEKRTFDVVGKFNGFTKWYLGSQYASGNSMDKACLTWTSKLAHAVHKPVEIDQD